MFSVGDRIEKTRSLGGMGGTDVFPVGTLGTVTHVGRDVVGVRFDTNPYVIPYNADDVEHYFSLYRPTLPNPAPFAAFQVGDRVRAKTSYTAHVGTEGEIYEVDADSVRIKWDGPDHGFTYISGNLDDYIDLVPATKRSVSSGLACSRCREFYPYAEPNQPDGSLKCYGCRQSY